jgi:2-iminobutanoate/2-iminopropanoate deaminase
MTMIKKTLITPENFTPSMGAYSHGLTVETSEATFIFVTGQIALDENGSLVSEDIEVQTRFVFERIAKILSSCNASFEDVVKAQIFLTDIKDFGKVSPVRNEYFGGSKPVSTLVEVSALVREGCKVEVEVIAIKSND